MIELTMRVARNPLAVEATPKVLSRGLPIQGLKVNTTDSKSLLISFKVNDQFMGEVISLFRSNNPVVTIDGEVVGFRDCTEGTVIAPDRTFRSFERICNAIDEIRNLMTWATNVNKVTLDIDSATLPKPIIDRIVDWTFFNEPGINLTKVDVGDIPTMEDAHDIIREETVVPRRSCASMVTAEEMGIDTFGERKNLIDAFAETQEKLDEMFFQGRRQLTWEQEVHAGYRGTKEEWMKSLGNFTLSPIRIDLRVKDKELNTEPFEIVVWDSYTPDVTRLPMDQFVKILHARICSSQPYIQVELKSPSIYRYIDSEKCIAVLKNFQILYEPGSDNKAGVVTATIDFHDTKIGAQYKELYEQNKHAIALGMMYEHHYGEMNETVADRLVKFIVIDGVRDYSSIERLFNQIGKVF